MSNTPKIAPAKGKKASRKKNKPAEGILKKRITSSRSVKDRPDTVEELAWAMQQSRLDGRTVAAKHITKAREVISQNPVEASRALCVNSLAQTATILAAISSQLSQPGTKVLEADGSLNPLIGESLLKMQDSMRRTIGTLLKLEGKGSTLPAPEATTDSNGDIASIILEVGDHEE